VNTYPRNRKSPERVNRNDILVLAQSGEGDECVEWPHARSSTGYGNLWTGERYRSAHKAAWEAIHGPVPPGQVVRHLCNNRPCIRIDHLAIGTHADNYADMRHSGNELVGEARSDSKLTEAQVRAIRAGRESGTTIRALADLYGVNVATVHSIIHRKTWKHI
jgi:hypothetical protein